MPFSKKVMPSAAPGFTSVASLWSKAEEVLGRAADFGHLSVKVAPDHGLSGPIGVAAVATPRPETRVRPMVVALQLVQSRQFVAGGQTDRGGTRVSPFQDRRPYYLETGTDKIAPGV